MAIMLDKHHQFEEAASALEKRGGRRYIEKTARGVSQHVVELGSSVLRWPLHYAEEAPPEIPKPSREPSKVRYESLFYNVNDTQVGDDS